MDVLFIDVFDFQGDSSLPLPSIGISTLATILLKANFSVDIINLAHERSKGTIRLENNYEMFSKKFVDLILSYNASIVGFTTMCDIYPYIIDISRKLKKKKSDVRIIFGGPQASLVANETMESFDFIDMIAIGECEDIIVDIVDALTSVKGKENIKLRDIPKIVYRQNGKICTSSVISQIYDTTDLPMIDDEIIEKYIAKAKTYSMDAGRGCPFNCTFCCTSSFWNRRFRSKPIENIIAEIKHINKKYGIKNFSLQHDLFTANKKNLHDFCNALIDENIGIEWGCSARIDTLDEKTIKLMAKSKCNVMFLGIETGSQRMQKIINKNFDVESVLPMIKLLKQNGFELTISFIYGFPDETEEDLFETLLLIHKIISLGVSFIQLHKLKLFPKTDEIDKVFNRMYFDKDNINCHFFESRYLEEVTDIISSSKILFSNFYEFECETRHPKWRHLHSFIVILRLHHKFFKYIYDVLFSVRNDIVSAYIHYLDTVDKEFRQLNSKNPEHDLMIEYGKKISSTALAILDSLVTETNDNTQRYMLKFGRDVLAFYEDKDCIEIVKKYPINVVVLHKEGLAAAEQYKNESITVKFTKNDKNDCKFKRIA